MIYDVIIVGKGPAGLSAALYSSLPLMASVKPK
jgi:Thioredoxin reductase